MSAHQGASGPAPREEVECLIHSPPPFYQKYLKPGVTKYACWACRDQSGIRAWGICKH